MFQKRGLAFASTSNFESADLNSSRVFHARESQGKQYAPGMLGRRIVIVGGINHISCPRASTYPLRATIRPGFMPVLTGSRLRTGSYIVVSFDIDLPSNSSLLTKSSFCHCSYSGLIRRAYTASSLATNCGSHESRLDVRRMVFVPSRPKKDSLRPLIGTEREREFLASQTKESVLPGPQDSANFGTEHRRSPIGQLQRGICRPKRLRHVRDRFTERNGSASDLSARRMLRAHRGRHGSSNQRREGSGCFGRTARCQKFQAMPQDRVEFGVRLEYLRCLGQSSPGISLSKPQLTKRPERPRLHQRRRRRGQRTVRRPIRVAHGDPGSRRTRYHQCALVHGSVMRGADSYQIARLMTSALGACLQMMQIHERSVRAPRDSAAMMVSPQHAPAHGGRYVLLGSLGLGCIP